MAEMEYNPYKAEEPDWLDEAAVEAYALDRMRTMLLMERAAKGQLAVKDTPFQRAVLKTAANHVERCEQRYGISRYDARIQVQIN